MIKKIFFLFTNLMASTVLAADPPPLIGGEMLPGTGQSELENAASASGWLLDTVFNNAINVVISIGAGLAVIFLIFGAYQYLTAFGDTEQIGQAHKTITFSLVGLAVALLAFAVVQIITGLEF